MPENVLQLRPKFVQKQPDLLIWYNVWCRASLLAQRLKRLPAMWETWVRSLGQEDCLEKEMAIHSSILACRIPWTETPGGPQSMGCKELDMLVKRHKNKCETAEVGKTLSETKLDTTEWLSTLINNISKSAKKGVFNCPGRCCFDVVTREGLTSGLAVKNPPTVQGVWVQPLGWEDPLEGCTATRVSVLAWSAPWTEEPDWQALGLYRVGHDWSNWSRVHSWLLN